MAGIDLHKKKLEETLNILLNTREGSNLETIVKQTNLDIFRTLGDTLFIDGESLNDLKNIGERVNPTGGILKEIDDQIASMPAITVKSESRDKLNAQKARIAGQILARNTEFNNTNAIIDTARNFETNINNTNITLSGGISIINLADTTTIDTENLDTKFTNGTITGRNFEIYDENATKLKKDSLGRYIVALPTKTGGNKNVAIDGINFSGSVLRFSNVRLFEPDTTTDIKDQIDLSKEIKLLIGCTLNIGSKKIGHQKTLKFKLNDTTAPVPLNDADQRTRYEIFNIHGLPINQYIQDFYDNNYKEIEDKLLDDIIEDATNTENKKVLRERIKNLIANGNPVSPFIVNQNEINDGFREYFFANVKPSADDISNSTKYNDFLRKNIPEQLKIYLEKELKRQIESTTNTPVGGPPNYLPTTRKLHDIITKEILIYRQQQEDRAQDNFVESHTLSGQIRSNKKKRSPKLSRDGLFGILGKKDVSYMRFLTNQSQEIGKQTVKIQTDRNKNKVEFTGYEAKINIGTVDNMSIEIKMDNGEEFTLKAGNHIALIKSLLNEPRIPYGKMRMHIVYNIIKAMIKIANKNNITLEYAADNIINSLSIDKNKDIILERIDDTTGIREKTKLFSEKDFNVENDMHQLRSGLENCLLYFNKSMEKIHKQYKKATDKRLFGYFSLSRAKFPTSWIGSPIKKLMNVRKSRTLNFDFPNTQVEGIHSNTSVSFSKNTFTITSDLLPKPISSKNLGKLLKTRIKGKRVFDGIERAIGGTIYKNLISKLRENSKIANTNFGVKDPVKNRVYFIDKSGEIGYISLANNKNPIHKSITKLFKKNYGIIKNLPSTGRIILTKPEEQKEVYQNPFIMRKFMKAMNSRLYSF